MKIFGSTIAFIQHIGETINAITHGNGFGSFMIGAGAVATAYVTPIVGLIVTCFALTVADMAYGIAVAKKQKQKITSDKNWKGTLQKLWHEIMLLAMARLVEFTVLDAEGVFVLTGGVTAIVSLTEMWSIIENLNTLYPKGPWKILGAFLKKKGEDYTGIELDLDTKNDDNAESNDINIKDADQLDTKA